jgi:hypothetical protein
VDLKAYYAEQRRRRQLAEQEFAARTHGWTFGVTPEAAAMRWAVLGNDRRAPVPPDRLTRLVLAADRAGVLAIAYASLTGLTAYDVLVKVMDTFVTPRASFEQS